MTLLVTEIFHSIQGESTRMGLPTVFIRLTGCPLRCTYCDTAYAFKGGERLSIEKILEKVSVYDTPYVTVTGGEPLSQKACVDLLAALCDAGYQVSLETSGALDIQWVDARVLIVMDLKTPTSGEVGKNLLKNLDYLKPADEIKCVISSRADYEWARAILETHGLKNRPILFSPSFEVLSLENLAAWILEDRLPVRLQTQLHKWIWPQIERGR